MVTKIVNLHIDKYDVYIGREGMGKSGYFGNPFKLDSSKKSTLSRYKVYFYERIENDIEFKDRVRELRGKILGCFCKPKSCHGDIICDYLNNIDNFSGFQI